MNEIYIDLERSKTNSLDKKAYLHGWLFTYNEYTDMWMATDRNNANSLWSDIKSEAVISSLNRDTLEDIIIKCKGDMFELIKWRKQFDGNNR